MHNTVFPVISISQQFNIDYDSGNSTAVKLVTKATQLRKIGTRGRRRKGRGASHLRIALFCQAIQSAVDAAPSLTTGRQTGFDAGGWREPRARRPLSKRISHWNSSTWRRFQCLVREDDVAASSMTSPSAMSASFLMRHATS
ncbi:hypothetical protein EVAR_50114_1 [Eumeta japonica]|uniref:Uncharacterized protein n=1 Tax=Eumeta variegata TaxID=151549 RepID=A0A4C1XX59_EUMVA|nr:hypothetical protein EVAR_50114_1 [Eumeta japonica]